MEWISVEDYLPNQSENVLAYIPNRRMRVCFLDTKNKWWNGDTRLVQSAITHWSHLPEPPKE